MVHLMDIFLWSRMWQSWNLWWVVHLFVPISCHCLGQINYWNWWCWNKAWVFGIHFWGLIQPDEAENPRWQVISQLHRGWVWHGTEPTELSPSTLWKTQLFAWGMWPGPSPLERSEQAIPGQCCCFFTLVKLLANKLSTSNQQEAQHCEASPSWCHVFPKHGTSSSAFRWGFQGGVSPNVKVILPWLREGHSSEYLTSMPQKVGNLKMKFHLPKNPETCLGMGRLLMQLFLPVI